MFDLWGEAAPVPLADLDLTPTEVTEREQAVWEKELMGVSLSEKPFSPVFGDADAAATFCGQIDAELAGQSIVVAGRLISVRHLRTKDNRAFASAILEDFSGQVEVMVWPKVYANTGDLWQEGNILLIEGKVRLRDDQVQLNCDTVCHYQPETAQDEGKVTVEPGEMPTVIEEEVANSRRLIVTITQSGDEATDIDYLHKLMDTLKDFPGQDEVNLRVISEEKIIKLKLSNMYTNYCSELHQRLVELVGEEGIELETSGGA